MKLHVHLAFALVSLWGTIDGQTTSALFTSELNIKFDVLEIKKFEKSVKFINDGENFLNQAKEQYKGMSEKEKSDRFCEKYQLALKKLYESSETTKSGYDLAYSVFYFKNEAFWQKMNRDNHRASGMEKAKYYEGSAIRNHNRSLIRRKQVMESDLFEYTLEIMEDAQEAEKLAVRDYGRALQICIDYPVEYNYGWDDDKSLEEIVKIMKDPIIHEPPKDIFATVDESANVDSTVIEDVIFKVQIVAHTMPLNQEYLDLLYRGSLPIDLIFEENWYKYSIGVYRTFEEADAARKEINIKKAFVVAYSEGRKISIKEAISIAEKKKLAGK
jgi:hypothetical protein